MLAEVVEYDRAARLLGGEAHGRGIRCPGPGHSRRDRSLSIKFDPNAPGGFIVHSFAGDNDIACKDYVRERLGLGGWRTDARAQPYRTLKPARTEPDGGQASRISLALEIWEAGCDIRGTLAETYLNSRKIETKDDFSHVLRFQPPQRKGALSHCGGMVALFRDIVTDEPCGIHTTFLDADACKVGRKMLGRPKAAAIKLDADEEITTGLHIGEGIETCLSGRQLGYRPVWALGSADAVGDCPLLAGIEAITVHAENGTKSTEAAIKVCERYDAAGVEAWALEPPHGDLNDYVKELAA